MTTRSNEHSPRRFLFSTGAGYGHFHPLVPLARALKQEGHDVAFAAGASLQTMVESAGFNFFHLGGIKREDDPEYRQFKAQQQAMPLSLESELFSYPRLFAGVGTRLRTPSLVEVARAWQPDMLIRDAAQYSAVIAAEHLGLPHVTVSFAAALKSMAYFEREAAAYLDPIRRSWGLPPDPTLASLYRYLVLAYSPPGFSLQDVSGPGVPEIPASIPPTTHFIRPEVFDNAANESLPDWIEQLPAQPTVYVTLGTEVNSEPELYPNVLQTIIAGLRDLPVNLIVTLGRDKDPADFGPQPANVHIERYIPQTLLLPRCDLMVMHGGSNSVLAALDVAVPMVVVPLIADQFCNANVAQRLRLGQVVQRDQLTSASIRTAVEEVLNNPIYRRNVGRLQAEMHALPGQEYAVELVERVVAEHKPVVNYEILDVADNGASL
jgi:UDP:flavonoid glycosyltransferase YjiC (YdhE family)